MVPDSDSDVELKTTIPKKIKKKAPKSPSEEHLIKEPKEPKKLTTKEMIHSALQELKSRKGTSLQAIKKYMIEKYSVDTEKLNFYIKKNIKSDVEKGIIVQIKGTGASGSFRLAPAKKPEKKKKIGKKEKGDKEKLKPTEKSQKKVNVEKPKSDKTKKSDSKSKMKQSKSKEPKMTKDADKKQKTTKEKKVKLTKGTKESKIVKDKGAKSKMAEGRSTPAKMTKKMMKRKSIGSIIKPPKMKPKMRE